MALHDLHNLGFSWKKNTAQQTKQYCQWNKNTSGYKWGGLTALCWHVLPSLWVMGYNEMKLFQSGLSITSIAFFPSGSIGGYYSWGSQLFTKALHVTRSKEISLFCSIFLFETFIFSSPHGTIVAESTARYKPHLLSHHGSRVWSITELDMNIWLQTSYTAVPFPSIVKSLTTSQYIKYSTFAFS